MGALTKVQLLLKHMQFIGLLQSIDIPFPTIYVDFSSLSNLISLDPSFLQSLDQNFPVFTFRLQFFFIAVALPLIIMILTLLVFVNFTTIMWMCFALSGILLVVIRVAGEFNQAFINGGDIMSTEYMAVMAGTVGYCLVYRLVGKLFNRWNPIVNWVKNPLSAVMLVAGGSMTGMPPLPLRITITAAVANLGCYVYKADVAKGPKLVGFLALGGGCAAVWVKTDVSMKHVFPEALLIPGYLLIALSAAGWLQFLMYANTDKGFGRAFVQARKRLQNMLDKSLLAVSFFFLSSAFVPVVTTCLQMFVCDTYNCALGTKFNPFLPVDYSKPSNATLRDRYCDPCLFEQGCAYNTATLCPEFNETRLFFHPETPCDDRVALYYQISAGLVLMVFVVVVSIMYYTIIQTISWQLTAFTTETYEGLRQRFEKMRLAYDTAKQRVEERNQLRRVRSSVIRMNMDAEEEAHNRSFAIASSPYQSNNNNGYSPPNPMLSMADGPRGYAPASPYHAGQQQQQQQPGGQPLLNMPQPMNLGASVTLTTSVTFDDDDDDPFADNPSNLGGSMKPPPPPIHARQLDAALLPSSANNYKVGAAPSPPAPQRNGSLAATTKQLQLAPPPPTPRSTRGQSIMHTLRSGFGSPTSTMQSSADDEELRTMFQKMDKEEVIEERAKAPQPPTFNDALLKVNAKIEPKASSLYNAYRREYQYFILLENIHRLALVVVSVFVSPKYPVASAVNLALHVGYFAVVLVLRPYVGRLEQMLAAAVALSDSLSSGYATLLWRMADNDTVTSPGLGFAVLAIGVVPILCGVVWQIVDMRKSLVNPYAQAEEKERKEREEKLKKKIADIEEKIEHADLLGTNPADIPKLKEEVKQLKEPIVTKEMKLTDELNLSTKRSILRFFVLGAIPLLLVALGLCVYATLNDPGQEFLNGSDLIQRTQATVLADRSSWAEFTDECCCFVSLEPMKGSNITERWVCADLLGNATNSGGNQSYAGGSTVSRNRQSVVESDGLPIRGVCRRQFAMPNCSVDVSAGVVSLNCPQSELDAANITTFAKRVLW